MEKLTHFKIGQIVNTQGLKGEVRVYPFTDDIYRFEIVCPAPSKICLYALIGVQLPFFSPQTVLRSMSAASLPSIGKSLLTKSLYVIRSCASLIR